MTGQVVAISMMKDEADVAGHVVAHLLEEGVDRVIIADNMSTDGTRDILEDLCVEHGEVTVVDDPEVAYMQSEKMSALAEIAGSEGAEWIVPFDADELWLAPDRVAKWLRDMSPAIQRVHADLYNHFETSIDEQVGNAFEKMVWRQHERGQLPKVAFRYQQGCVVHQGNHGVDLPVAGGINGGLEIRHFPYRGFDHFRRKAINGAAAYAATDLPYTMGAHWRGYAQILEQHGDDALREVYNTYFRFLSPVDAGMIKDPAAWCRWSKLAANPD